MLDKARSGEFDLIITKSISRFARNTVTVLKVARELKELGVGIFLKNKRSIRFPVRGDDADDSGFFRPRGETEHERKQQMVHLEEI